MVWMKAMTILAVIDVLLAAILITIYVSLLSDHLPELQLIQGSKSYHLGVYLYVATCTLVQLFVAFKFYQVLTLTQDDKDHYDNVLWITKIWIVASYFLLVNWVLKAGIYAQRCDCGMSVALAAYLMETVFRVCAICAGSAFMKKLGKHNEEMKAQLKMRAVLSSLKSRKSARHNSIENDKINSQFGV